MSDASKDTSERTGRWSSFRILSLVAAVVLGGLTILYFTLNAGPASKMLSMKQAETLALEYINEQYPQIAESRMNVSLVSAKPGLNAASASNDSLRKASWMFTYRFIRSGKQNQSDEAAGLQIHVIDEEHITGELLQNLPEKSL